MQPRTIIFFKERITRSLKEYDRLKALGDPDASLYLTNAEMNAGELAELRGWWNEDRRRYKWEDALGFYRPMHYTT